MSTRPYQELSLVEELLEAANHLDIAQRYRVADRLRQRAAWVRELEPTDLGWEARSVFERLTGPVPAAETAPSERKERGG